MIKNVLVTKILSCDDVNLYASNIFRVIITVKVYEETVLPITTIVNVQNVKKLPTVFAFHTNSVLQK